MKVRDINSIILYELYKAEMTDTFGVDGNSNFFRSNLTDPEGGQLGRQ